MLTAARVWSLEDWQIGQGKVFPRSSLVTGKGILQTSATLKIHLCISPTCTMSVAFWNIELKQGQKYVVDIPPGFILNLQQAALSSGKTAQVWVKTESIEGDILNALLCTLRETSVDQCMLQLVFGSDVQSCFEVQGSGSGVTVHLSGYFQPGPHDDDSSDASSFSEQELDDDEMEAFFNERVANRADDDEEDDEEESSTEEKDDEEEEEEEDDSDDEEDDEDDGRLKRPTEKIKIADVYADGRSSSSDDDDDDDDDEAFVKKMMKKHDDKTSPKVMFTNSSSSESESESGSDDPTPGSFIKRPQPKGVVTNHKASSFAHQNPTKSSSFKSKPNQNKGENDSGKIAQKAQTNKFQAKPQKHGGSSFLDKAKAHGGNNKNGGGGGSGVHNNKNNKKKGKK